MYSHEIDNVLKEKNYVIESNLYDEICKNSPQISRVTFNAFSNNFSISTDDNWHWTFNVYLDTKN